MKKAILGTIDMGVFTKAFASGLIAAACAVPAAQAVTFEFTYTGLTDSRNKPGSMAALGVSEGDSLVYAVTLDPDAVPRFGPPQELISRSPDGSINWTAFLANYGYEALSIGIAGQTFVVPFASNQDRFSVRDGIDGTRTTFDQISLVAGTDFGGPNGTLIEYASMGLTSFDDTVLTGTAVPRLADVLAVAAGEQYGANLQFTKNGEDWQIISNWSNGGTLSVRELATPDIAPIPGPAALPLMATGLGLLGWLGIRRRRRPA